MEKKFFGATDGVRGEYGKTPLTPEIIFKLSFGFAQFLEGEATKEVLVGRDTRVSGIEIVKYVTAGLRAGGRKAKIMNGDRCIPSPALAILTATNAEAGGAIMVTASHNPAKDNGLKVLRADGSKLTDAQEVAVEQIAVGKAAEQAWQDYEASSQKPSEDNVVYACEQEYAKILKQDLTDDFGFDLERVDSPMEVGLDSAAGAGFRFSPWVLGDLDIESVEVGPLPNGKNINKACGALHPEKLAERVKQDALDFGLALDGDADRAVLVDESGRIWDGDRIVAMLALWMKERGKLLNNKVVMTEYSNLAAIKYLEAQGVEVEKVEVGDRAVAAKCKEIGAVLGGEKAGHIIYRPWLESSDGTFVIALVACILRETGKKLSELWPDYEEYPSKQVKIYVREKKPLAEIRGLEAGLKLAKTVLGERGRVFVRYSGTEMAMRILVEADDAKSVREISHSLADLVQNEIGVKA